MDGLSEIGRYWINEGTTVQVVINPELPSHLRVREVVALFTEPEQRNKGYATELMKEVCAEADKCAIVLILKPERYGNTGGHKNLQAFYQKLGFVKVQQKPVLMARAPVFNPVRKIIVESLSG
jgi:predicted GNAT family acetyltransferase